MRRQFVGDQRGRLHPLDVFTYTESDGNGGTTTGTLTVTVVRPPLVTANNVTATSPGQVFAATSLFSATDPGGYPITHYYFYDWAGGTGYWALNGVAEPANTVLAVTPAQLSQVTFHSGTTGSDDLLICADDAYSESPWTEFHVSAAASMTAPSANAAEPPAPDLANGVLSFSEADTSSTPAVSIVPASQDATYVGSFSVDTVNTADGQATVGWRFNLDPTPVTQAVTQSDQVTMTEAHADGTSTAASQTVSVTIGGADNNSFAFHPGVGADAIVNAHSTDTIELDGFASVPNSNTLAQLLQEAQNGQAQSMFTAVNGGHDTLITLDSHDSLTLTNIRIADLHANSFIVH
jgi:VCBS repeat-containing protein